MTRMLRCLLPLSYLCPRTISLGCEWAVRLAEDLLVVPVRASLLLRLTRGHDCHILFADWQHPSAHAAACLGRAWLSISSEQ